MKRLQTKIRTLRVKLQELRANPLLLNLRKEEKEVFYEALKKLGEFEDMLIINHIIKK